MIKKNWFLIITFFFNQLIFAQFDDNQNIKVSTERHFVSNGVENIMRGSGGQRDEDFGYIARPNSYQEWIKLKDGKEIFRTIATIDKDGFRTSTASRRPGKSKHLLLIDSSSIFGEGLKDEQTLAHLINLRSNVYEAYPVAFYAYGPQHHWLQFKKKKIQKLIREKKGRAILFMDEGNIKRFFGDINTLSYAARFPFVEEESPGKFVHRGNFKNSGLWWQKLVINYCLPYEFCAGWAARSASRAPSEDQYAVIGRLCDDIDHMYREQFDVEDFSIIFIGNGAGFASGAAKLALYTKVKVIPLLRATEDIYQDFHFTPSGVRNISDFLYDSKLIQ